MQQKYVDIGGGRECLYLLILLVILGGSPCAPGAARTRNLQLRRLTLYPIELQAHDWKITKNLPQGEVALKEGCTVIQE